MSDFYICVCGENFGDHLDEALHDPVNADTYYGGGPDTFARWLYARVYQIQGAPDWEELPPESREYWDHEAAAVKRAVARGGFKVPNPNIEIDPPPVEADGGLPKMEAASLVNTQQPYRQKPSDEPMAQLALSMANMAHAQITDLELRVKALEDRLSTLDGGGE